MNMSDQELKNDVQTIKNILKYLMEFNPKVGVWDEWHIMTKIKANGGDKVIKPVEVQQTDFLSGQFVIENHIEILTVESKAELVSREFDDKEHPGQKKTVERVEVSVICDDKNKTKRLWSMNKTSRNMVVEVLGEDETQWIGKKVPVVVNTTVGTKPAIYPNAVSFAKMHTNNGTLD